MSLQPIGEKMNKTENKPTVSLGRCHTNKAGEIMEQGIITLLGRHKEVITMLHFALFFLPATWTMDPEMPHRILSWKGLWDLALVFLRMDKTLQSTTDQCGMLTASFLKNSACHSLETEVKIKAEESAFFLQTDESCAYRLPAGCSWGVRFSLACQTLSLVLPVSLSSSLPSEVTQKSLLTWRTVWQR